LCVMDSHTSQLLLRSILFNISWPLAQRLGHCEYLARLEWTYIVIMEQTWQCCKYCSLSMREHLSHAVQTTTCIYGTSDKNGLKLFSH
ncbi:hypothetical protein DPMN_054377, partial [Dreissena polymorpha]